MSKLWIVALLAAALVLCPGMTRAEQVDTSAAACIVIDAASGRTLLEHNADACLPMASTTKVMTALLALERGQLDDRVVAGRNAFGVPGTSIYLDLGESLSLEEMLYGLMLASGNDAAVAIAEHIGGTVEEFCRMMTERAAELGCKSTVFLSPHGLPMEGHYTTARDLARIACEAMTHDKFREIVSTTRAKIPWSGREYDRVLNNKNRLLTGYEGSTGIKTGYTRAAGRCLVFGAKRDGMEIIGVVLNCYDWFDEAARLMDCAFARYEAASLLRTGDRVRAIPVVRGDTEWVQAVLTDELAAVVPKGRIPTLCMEVADVLEAPVSAGQPLGYAALEMDGEELCRVQVVAGTSVSRDDYAAHWDACWQCWPLLK